MARERARVRINNEREWLRFSHVPLMLEWLIETEDMISDRKLRLFACAVVKEWVLLDEDRPDDLRRFHVQCIENGLAKADSLLLPHKNINTWLVNSSPTEAAYRAAKDAMNTWGCNILRSIVGSPFFPLANHDRSNVSPFSSPTIIKPEWKNDHVRSLAMTCYEGDWSALLPLTDALKEQGCDLPEIVNPLLSKVRCPKCIGRGKATKVEYGSKKSGKQDMTDTLIDCEACKGSGWAKMPCAYHRGFYVIDLLLDKS